MPVARPWAALAAAETTERGQLLAVHGDQVRPDVIRCGYAAGPIALFARKKVQAHSFSWDHPAMLICLAHETARACRPRSRPARAAPCCVVMGRMRRRSQCL